MKPFPQILAGFTLSLLAACSPGTGDIDPPGEAAGSSTASSSPIYVAETPIPFQLEPLTQIPHRVTFLTSPDDGSDRLFITERDGRIRIYKDGLLLETPFLDIEHLVDHASWEQGLLSMAFSPNYTEDGEFYVYYINLETDNDTVVARYRVSEDPDVADPDSAEVSFFLEQPANNHNGGLLAFGPDGYLYIGLGDGGKGNDPWDNAENRSVLLGKILRLDVNGQDTYAIPADNPFVEHPDFRPEIWAYGLRNPWRFAFDRLTGDLFIADVGQNEIEEISFEPAGSSGGNHYGWDTLEGSHCFEPAEDCDTTGKVAPIHDYAHGSQHCAGIGGFVYRGMAIPKLQGIYVFGDYCSGVIWGLRPDDSGGWEHLELIDTELAISSFGEDWAGELYVIDLEGQIFIISP